MPNNPTWIEPPPQKKSGLGCFAKGCLGLVAVGALLILLLGFGGYFVFSHGSKPTPLPIEELAPDALANVQERVKQFKSTGPPPSPTAAEAVTPGETPTPAPASQTPVRQLVLTAGEINGMISANRKSRGHAFVTLSGNTATVQMSLPSDKIPGFPPGYLNGTFSITTDGPTPLSAVRVSKIRANGLPMPSGVLSMTVGGRSIMGYALEAIAPYKVSTVEVEDGRVIAR